MFEHHIDGPSVNQHVSWGREDMLHPSALTATAAGALARISSQVLAITLTAFVCSVYRANR